MSRAIGLITLIFALLSVVTPSVAVGSRGFVAHPDALVLLQDDGTYVMAPCPITGKLPVHCRPDMGVMPAISFIDPVPAKPVMRPVAEPARERLVVPPTLPPPRAA